MAEPQNLNTSLIALIGFVSAVLTFVIVLVLQTLFLGLDAAVQKRVASVSPASKASRLIAEQEGRLATWAWIDRTKGQVQIPIEQAMAITVNDYRREATDANVD